MKRSTTLALLVAIFTLTACGELAAPNLDEARPTAAEAAPPSDHSDLSDLADPYTGSWTAADLSFGLTHDTTIVIAGRPSRSYSGQGSYNEQAVVVSAFDADDGLALYVDRFAWPDALEPLLYGHVTRGGERLVYEVSEPMPGRIVLGPGHAQGAAQNRDARADIVLALAAKRMVRAARASIAAEASEPAGSPDYVDVYGDWRFCMTPMDGGAVPAGADETGAVTGGLTLEYDATGHFKASTGISAPLELTVVEVNGPYFSLAAAVRTGQRTLPLWLTGFTLNDYMAAELVWDGAAYGLVAGRGRMDDECLAGV